ncbi:hypothetical protein ABBQ38_012103 [Trebouxia sp. C0009 RCD-2024]
MAVHVDPDMVDISRLKRLAEEKRVLRYVLVLGSPGLIIVDHIHFQYNGMLLGELPL